MHTFHTHVLRMEYIHAKMLFIFSEQDRMYVEIGLLMCYLPCLKYNYQDKADPHNQKKQPFGLIFGFQLKN